MTNRFWQEKWLKDQFNERNPGQRKNSSNAAASDPTPGLAPLWLLWGRIEATGGEYAAIASAIPNNGPESALKTNLRTFQTWELAEAALRSMLVELGNLVRAEGGRIGDVETDGV